MKVVVLTTSYPRNANDVAGNFVAAAVEGVRAQGVEVDGLTMQALSAEAVLQRHGMRTDGNRLILSNTSTELKRLVEGTPFEADLRGVLLRVKGADRYENRSIKFNGGQGKTGEPFLFIVLAVVIAQVKSDRLSFSRKESIENV